MVNRPIPILLFPVMNTLSNNLLEKLQVDVATLGTTAAGRAWCAKSLHPSSSQPDYLGIPSGPPFPVIDMTYNQNTTISPPSGITSAQTWECAINLVANPASFGTYQTWLTGDSVVTSGNFGNDQIPGATWNAKTAAFSLLCEQYRFSFGAATIHYDAPALSDQGMVAVAQYPFGQRCVDSAPSTGYLKTPLNMIESTDVLMSFDDMQQMRRAYLGRAKDGVYTTLKVGSEGRDWINSNDVMSLVWDNTGAPAWGASAITSYTSTLAFPLANTGASYCSGTSWSDGAAFPKFNSGQMARVYFKNLSATASLSLYHRMGFEFKVRPSTTLAPLQTDGTAYDPLALEMHDRVMREMQDAYPEDYNSKDTLFRVIRTIAGGLRKSVIPLASSFLPAGNPLSQIAMKAADAVLAKAEQHANKKLTANKPPLMKR